MFFDTPIFVFFLTAVVLLYWRLGWAGQNKMLLVASCFFYGWWDWRFLLLMMTSATFDFLLAQKIADSENPKIRRSLLTFSLLLNFGFLGVFKYYNFFASSLLDGLTSLGVTSVSLPLLLILLPPGISFYTFQEVAYIIDVYHGRLQPSRRFVDYSLFICLFPHLIAGPIQRPSHLLPQVQHPRVFDAEKFFGGLMLILTGLFRKTLIADNAANIANAAFDGRIGHSFGATVIGVLAFALQIYGDFSGYSDIARGSAQLLGFHFMVNFRQPYFASSLQDFWRRWHISLSTWLRDYLYIPLGGNRLGTVRTYGNLMATMLLGGLWHGANWTFVLWGGLHGCWLAIERFSIDRFSLSAKTAGPGARFNPLGWVVTMAIVGLSWLFFRAKDIHQATAMLADLRVLEWHPAFGPILIYLAAIITAVLLVDLRLELCDEEYPFEKSRSEFAIVCAMLLTVATIALGAMDINAFIYFQF